MKFGKINYCCNNQTFEEKNIWIKEIVINYDINTNNKKEILNNNIDTKSNSFLDKNKYNCVSDNDISNKVRSDSKNLNLSLNNKTLNINSGIIKNNNFNNFDGYIEENLINQITGKTIIFDNKVFKYYYRNNRYKSKNKIQFIFKFIHYRKKDSLKPKLKEKHFVMLQLSLFHLNKI